MKKPTKDHRKLKAEILVLCGVPHDAVPRKMKAMGEHITAGSVNGMMRDYGWAKMRGTDQRAPRLAEIAATSPKLAEIVERQALAAQEDAKARLRGSLTDRQRMQLRLDATLVRDIAVAAKARIEAAPAEPEAARETVDRVVAVYDPEDKETRQTVVAQNLSNCTLSWMASRGIIPEQLASAGIKFRADFHRIGGGLQSTHPKQFRVDGRAPGGMSGGALDAMQKRKQVFAALRHLYPTDAASMERVLHLVCVEDRNFKEMREIGEAACANRKALLAALEPVGWAYGDWLNSMNAIKLQAWWKAIGSDVPDVEP